MASHYTTWEDCRELGTGTFGVVRAARRKSDGLEVALKKIKRDPSYSQCGLSYSALREIRVMRELKHSNVVELLDVFVSDGSVVLVLELLSSTDLEGVIRKAREMTIKLEPADIKSYLQMFLQGLAFLHAHFILHRDVHSSLIKFICS
jgi:cyclin-dependent kinase 7